jgi:catechol 2,3-dioxygenase-like lactoylglutathione lyase family enzyme
VTLIRPHHFHRLALAVTDVDAAAAWLEAMFGARPVAGSDQLMQNRPGRDVGDLAGTETRLLWVGGYPVILLGGGVVASFLARHGPGVQSFAWEVDDNWEVEHIVRDRGIGVVSVNVGGRFFFMHPQDTHGLLLEWCDGKMPRDPTSVEPGRGVVETTGLAWVCGVVADAGATAEWMADLMETTLVEGNPKGPAHLERTIDLAVGDITVRLVTPCSAESRYAAALERGPRVHSFAVRVPDLDAALVALESEGIGVPYRAGALASTDPAATLGLRIDWTE